MPSVSVIIPTYNRADVLINAIESALSQTFESIEVIVVDDGSDDETRDVIETLADPRLRFVQIQHAGPSTARNRGILESRGDFVAFLDSDDVWYPHKLEAQLPLFDDADVGWVYGDLDYFGPDGPEQRRFERCRSCRGWIMRSLFVGGCPMLTTSVVLRRTCLDRVGMFDPALLRWQDNDLYFRLANSFQVDFVDEPVGRYWHRPRDQSTQAVRISRWRTRTVKQRALALDPDLWNCPRVDLRTAHLNNILELARLELSLGNRTDARRLFLECLNAQPYWWKPALGLAGSYLPPWLSAWAAPAKLGPYDSAPEQAPNPRVITQERARQPANFSK